MAWMILNRSVSTERQMTLLHMRKMSPIIWSLISPAKTRTNHLDPLVPPVATTVIAALGVENIAGIDTVDDPTAEVHAGTHDEIGIDTEMTDAEMIGMTDDDDCSKYKQNIYHFHVY